MPISIPCSCGKQLRVADSLAGKAYQCPSCGARLMVPRAATGGRGPVDKNRDSGTSTARPSRPASKSGGAGGILLVLACIMGFMCGGCFSGLGFAGWKMFMVTKEVGKELSDADKQFDNEMKKVAQDLKNQQPNDNKKDPNRKDTPVAEETLPADFREDFDFVPDAAGRLITVRAAELVKLVPEKRDQPNSYLLDRCNNSFGLKPEDVIRITEVTSGLFTYVVIVTKSNVDPQKVKLAAVGANAKEVAFKDKKYFEAGEAKFGTKPCLYQQGKRVFVSAFDRSAIETALGGYPRKKKDGLVSAAIEKALLGKTHSIAVNESLKKDNFSGPLRGNILSMTAGAGNVIQIEHAMTFWDEKEAAGIKKRREESLKADLEKIDTSKASDDEKAVTRSLSYQLEGDTLTVTQSGKWQAMWRNQELNGGLPIQL